MKYAVLVLWESCDSDSSSYYIIKTKTGGNQIQKVVDDLISKWENEKKKWNDKKLLKELEKKGIIKVINACEVISIEV